MARRTKRRVATVKGVCGHVCYTVPQTSLVVDEKVVKAVHCLYCQKFVPIKDGESVVLRYVPIPRPPKGPERTIPLF